MEEVRCPICNMPMSNSRVNQHLDKGCEQAEADYNKKKSSSPDHAWFIRSNDKDSDKGTIKIENGSHKEIEAKDKETKRITTNTTAEIPTSITTGFKRLLDSDDRIAKRKTLVPLAEQVRPRSLDDFIGQEDLVGPSGVLRRFIDRDTCPSMILWGPSGVGKTTLARILANTTKSRFVELSATSHGVNDCKRIFEEARNELLLTGRRTILFLDEVHRFNRAQQDIFLPQVERGDITLIGATTENPSFKLNGALLSRCRVFVLRKLSSKAIVKLISRAVGILNDQREEKLELDSDAIEYLGDLADGDGRMGLNLLEMAMGLGRGSEREKLLPVSKDTIRNALKRTHMLYDRVGDMHYDTISALHKSVRGNDADAALYYLGRMLESGEDPLYVARRMVRMASEDVGLADDSCLPFAVATYTAVQQVGMPEADCMLAHCVVKLARAPKSVMVYRGYNAVKHLLQQEPGASSAEIPVHLRNAPTKLMKELGYGKEYKYNPSYEGGIVDQQYMPEGFDDVKFLPKKHLGED